MTADLSFLTGVMDDNTKRTNRPRILLILSIFLSEVVTNEVPRPHGVALSRAPLYNPGEDFHCFDGSQVIPFLQVNDDYCDCLDASDEPGTSACPHGIFHCRNAGHKSLNIPSNRVNDGICDCCDGSDEYLTAHCADECHRIGQHAREEALRRAELVKAGKQLRIDMSERGVNLKREKKEQLIDLQRNKEEAERVKSEKEALKDKAEESEKAALEVYRKIEEEEKQKRLEEEERKNRAEATEYFDKFDSNKDGKVDLAELQTRQSFDKDRNGEVSNEEALYFLNNQESADLEAFISECWSNIKPYLMMDAGLFKPPQQKETAREEIENVEDGEVNEGEGEEEQEDLGEEEEQEEDEDIDEPQQIEEPSTPIPYDDETRRLVDAATAARDEFAQAERAVRDIDNEISKIEEYFEKDFGPDEEFAILAGECFEYTDHEYIYRLCPFDRTVQKPKSGAAETRLGTWGRWNGPDNDRYQSMLYDRGQSCWNGPQRSTIVRVGCGVENKLLAVAEPNKCEYVFDFVTPAACADRQGTNPDEEDLHDEL